MSSLWVGCQLLGGRQQTALVDKYSQYRIKLKITFSRCPQQARQKFAQQKEEETPSPSWAEVMKEPVGKLSFDVPADLHDRLEKIFADISGYRHYRRSQE